MAHSITVLVTYSKAGKTLFNYSKQVESAAAFRAAIDEAYEGFCKANPGVSLFDGVTVLYDKAD